MTESTHVTEHGASDTVLRQVRRTVRDAKEEIEVVDREVQRFVRKSPLVASLAALAVGFAIGRVFSRI